MKFLLVDDHDLILKALALLLKAKFTGSEVLTGSTAEDVRRLVHEHGEDADLLILDLNLPGVTTPTSLLEELVSNNPALKILVLSGVVDQMSILRVLQLGAAGFVPKSIDTDMLTDAISFVLKGGVYIPAKLIGDAPAGRAADPGPRPTRQAHLPRAAALRGYRQNAHHGDLPRLRGEQPHRSAHRRAQGGLRHHDLSRTLPQPL